MWSVQFRMPGSLVSSHGRASAYKVGGRWLSGSVLYTWSGLVSPYRLRWYILRRAQDGQPSERNTPSVKLQTKIKLKFCIPTSVVADSPHPGFCSHVRRAWRQTRLLVCTSHASGFKTCQTESPKPLCCPCVQHHEHPLQINSLTFLYMGESGPKRASQEI